MPQVPQLRVSGSGIISGYFWTSGDIVKPAKERSFFEKTTAVFHSCDMATALQKMLQRARVCNAIAATDGTLAFVIEMATQLPCPSLDFPVSQRRHRHKGSGCRVEMQWSRPCSGKPTASDTTVYSRLDRSNGRARGY